MNNNQLVVISSFIKDLNFKAPMRSKVLDKVTVKKINNAIEHGIIDNQGHIWICCSKLHVILRVKTKVDAQYLLESISKKYKANYGGNIYVRWASLISIISRRIEDNPSNKYLPLVFEILKEINECNDVKILRLEAKTLREKNLKRLKWQRIKNYNLINDELTGETLNKAKAQFSHIRSVTMYPEISEMLWNGLVINIGTHATITELSINDENQLYELCYNKGWNLGWYDIYKEYIAKSLAVEDTRAQINFL